MSFRTAVARSVNAAIASNPVNSEGITSLKMSFLSGGGEGTTYAPNTMIAIATTAITTLSIDTNSSSKTE
jgi:hypothetical protein